jgi:hypothetical protein
MTFCKRLDRGIFGAGASGKDERVPDGCNNGADEDMLPIVGCDGEAAKSLDSKLASSGGAAAPDSSSSSWANESEASSTSQTAMPASHAFRAPSQSRLAVRSNASKCQACTSPESSSNDVCIAWVASSTERASA